MKRFPGLQELHEAPRKGDEWWSSFLSELRSRNELGGFLSRIRGNSLLEKRAWLVAMLNDRLDRPRVRAEEESLCEAALERLMPATLDPRRDCIYCLRGFGSAEALQRHSDEGCGLDPAGHRDF